MNRFRNPPDLQEALALIGSGFPVSGAFFVDLGGG
ncbi:hypothetical protein DENIT_110180 [Pseudomonas veronii]|nr:hypothetical protein DENIT_110180 [Pseudomonas veronii]